MKKILCRGLIALALSASFYSPAAAATWNGETEGGGGENSPSFASQYLFFNDTNWNLLARYFYVDDVLERGEFALGPTFALRGVELQWQFGATTNRDVMAALTIVTSVRDRSIVYIGDAKISTTERPDTFYQKLFVALVPSGAVQLRLEDFLVDRKQGFLRLGLEGRIQLGHGVHLFIAPFYDPDNHEWGGQGGVRFFGW